MTASNVINVADLVISEMAKLRKIVTQPGTPLGNNEHPTILLQLGFIEPVEASRQIYVETPLGRGVFIDYLLRHPPATQITGGSSNQPKDLKYNFL